MIKLTTWDFSKIKVFHVLYVHVPKLVINTEKQFNFPYLGRLFLGNTWFLGRQNKF
jgi:hypothetical protein